MAVTDHHDIAFLPYVIAAAERLGPDRRLIVFPGIEITCSDNVQGLAIFEPGTEPSDWRRLLSRLDAVTETAPEAPKTDQIRHCGLTVEALFGGVAADATLATRIMLVPHFSREGAHKSLNAEGFAPRFAGLPCNGVYIECPHGDLDTGTLDQAQGRTEEWGRRRRAILATGDNRNEGSRILVRPKGEPPGLIRPPVGPLPKRILGALATPGRVRTAFVVLPPPRLDLAPRVGQRQKPVRVQALVAQPAVERLDQCVVGRLARP